MWNDRSDKQVKCPYCGYQHDIGEDGYMHKTFKVPDAISYSMKDFKMWKCKNCHQYYATEWNPFISYNHVIYSDDNKVIPMRFK